MRMAASFHIPGSELFRYFFAYTILPDTCIYIYFSVHVQVHYRLFDIQTFLSAGVRGKKEEEERQKVWKAVRYIHSLRDHKVTLSDLGKFDLSAVDREHIKRHKIRETNALERSFRGFGPWEYYEFKVNEGRGVEAVCVHMQETFKLKDISLVIFPYSDIE